MRGEFLPPLREGREEAGVRGDSRHVVFASAGSCCMTSRQYWGRSLSAGESGPRVEDPFADTADPPQPALHSFLTL